MSQGDSRSRASEALARTRHNMGEQIVAIVVAPTVGAAHCVEVCKPRARPNCFLLFETKTWFEYISQLFVVKGEGSRYRRKTLLQRLTSSFDEGCPTSTGRTLNNSRASVRTHVVGVGLCFVSYKEVR